MPTMDLSYPEDSVITIGMVLGPSNLDGCYYVLDLPEPRTVAEFRIRQANRTGYKKTG